MEYIRSANSIVLRLDKGEELVAAVTELANRENIRTASFVGLGATDSVTLGVFDTAEKQYYSYTYEGTFEIASCVGTVTRMNGEPYLHLHMTVADPSKNLVYAGHLNRCRISATGEFVLTLIEAEVGRYKDEEIGLNLMKF